MLGVDRRILIRAGGLKKCMGLSEEEEELERVKKKSTKKSNKEKMIMKVRGKDRTILTHKDSNSK
jgi:hypothetical protein